MFSFGVLFIWAYVVNTHSTWTAAYDFFQTNNNDNNIEVSDKNTKKHKYMTGDVWLIIVHII